MGKFEVNQSQWQTEMGENPSNFEKSCGGNCPVENVSYIDVKRFIDRLNAKNYGLYYGLPTEAQWEYAARGGSDGRYGGNLEEMAWYNKNSDGLTHPVGSKAPNGCARC